MEQIIETIQLSKFDTTGVLPKQTLLDKKYTLDDPIFENSGKINIPCGEDNEFFELKDVNFVYLLSDCPFNLLINNLVILNTKQFSFVNPNKTITISIAANSKYNLVIEYVYGLLKCGDQNTAIKAISRKNNVKWDRVLKKVIIEQPESKDFHKHSKLPHPCSEQSTNDQEHHQDCHHHDHPCHEEHQHHDHPCHPHPKYPIYNCVCQQIDPCYPPPLPPIRPINGVPNLKNLDDPTDDLSSSEHSADLENDEMLSEPDINNMTMVPPILGPRPHHHHHLMKHLNPSSAIQLIKEVHDVVKDEYGKPKYLLLKR